MANLTDLSNELLLIIASYLTTGTVVDTQALSNLCLTTRGLLSIAQPALYTCIEIREPPGDPLKPLKSFLKTLLGRPELGEAAQELALTNDRAIRYEWPALQHDPYFMDISEAVGGHPHEIEPELCYHPLAVEVLARLPNLRSLRFTANIEAPRSLLQYTHQLQADSNILSKLKTFQLHKRYEDGPIDIEDYIPFLHYPSFEKLSTQSTVADAFYSARATNTITPSTVELLWCIRPLPTMERLLDACSNLTLFNFVVPDGTRYRSMSDVGSDPLVAPRELAIALLNAHGPTLETLRLDFHHFYRLRDREIREQIEESGGNLEDCDFTYPSFRDCEKLTRMTIELEKLVKLHHLPTALEHLRLEYCHFPDLDQKYLGELIQLKETWCPAIQSVIVSGWEMSNEGITAVREHVRSLEAPVQVSEDGRTLTFLGTANYLQIQSRESTADQEGEDEEDSDEEDDDDDDDATEDGDEGEETDGGDGGEDMETDDE
ncbi:hypothetical protein CC86DRAFT_463177 [Ophiobolus disseminans]|uniref:F-box domain-containing protein n=1 Tax=Ophiobolus disseminans TaxID=1469910 RepID=A0A6A7AF01_9PLEO|nr:hypothetical protein CC86DRAFT_463177 [Ophiobolus disseminans]